MTHQLCTNRMSHWWGSVRSLVTPTYSWGALTGDRPETDFNLPALLVAWPVQMLRLQSQQCCRDVTYHTTYGGFRQTHYVTNHVEIAPACIKAQGAAQFDEGGHGVGSRTISRISRIWLGQKRNFLRTCSGLNTSSGLRRSRNSLSTLGSASTRLCCCSIGNSSKISSAILPIKPV